MDKINSIIDEVFCNKEKRCKYVVGDILKSEDEYYVRVCKNKDGDLYGSLVCEIGHSCRDIPYALNNGIGYTNITNYKFIRKLL